MARRAENPIALAYKWVARVFAVVVMMFVPGLAGKWLDERWGTGFLAMAGFGLGLVGGMAYLIAATRARGAAEELGHVGTVEDSENKLGEAHDE